MASTSELTAGWLKSGGQASNPEQASQALAGEEMSPATDNSDTDVRAENSTSDELLSEEGGDTPEDSQEISKEAKAASKEKPTTGTSAKEVVTVTDEQGRKRKVEIDYSNRETIKQAHLLAAGARKWQAERDQVIQKHKATETQLKAKDAQLGELQGDWGKLDSAFKANGAEGVFDLLNGPGAFKAYVSKQMERAKFVEQATPTELKALEREERAESDRREVDRIRKENEDFRKEITQEREASEMKSLQSTINPVFEKYRFADKLGDAGDEHMFDRMLWRTAMDKLEEYEDQGLEITQEMVNREFSATAAALKRRINVNAEKKAAKAVDQKKREATENVQAKVMSGYKTSGKAQEARDLINKGDITTLMKKWSTYGGLFQGKK